jgi:hypothetical protein
LSTPVCKAYDTVILAAPTVSYKVISTKETDDCWISFIEDESGLRSIVKQVKDKNPDEQFLLVIDALACTIAQEQKIPMNKVSLIPPGVPFSGKVFPDRLASLHSLAPGQSAEEALPWPDFDLHQRAKKRLPPDWKNWEPIPLEEAGLTPSIISNMSQHRSLSKIAALDTFLGNGDRSNPNIFFDPSNQTFCGIDMAAAFNSILAAPTCFQIKRIMSGEIQLSQQEILALKTYRLALNSLVQNYSAETLCKRLEHVAIFAGFSKKVQNRIAHHKKNIRENYLKSQELVHLLNSAEILDILDSWPNNPL